MSDSTGNPPDERDVSGERHAGSVRDAGIERDPSGASGGPHEAPNADEVPEHPEEKRPTGDNAGTCDKLEHAAPKSGDAKRSDHALLKKIWFAYFSGLLIWTVLTYGHTVRSYTEDKLFAYVQDGMTYTADFILYYNNGILSWDAWKYKIDIYDPHLQNQYLQQLVPNVKLEKIFYSQYPPYLFAIMLPLPFLPMKTVWIIWELAGIFGIAFSVYHILKTTLKGTFTRAFTYVAVFASFPGWLCFRLGQVALILYPAIMFYWMSLDQKKWFRAGLLGGFCLLKLQYMPVMFLTGIFLGGWRFFAGYTLMGLFYLGLTIGVLGIDNLLRYPAALKFGEISGEVTGVAPESQQNLRGQLVVLLNNDGDVVHLIATVFWLAASLFLGYLWWRESQRRKREAAAIASTTGSADAGESGNSTGDGSQKSSSPSLTLAQNLLALQRQRFMVLASATMLIALISSPHTHKQDYIFMTIPCIWLIYSVIGNYPLEAAPVQGASKKALLALRYLLIGFPVLSWIFFISGQILPVTIIQPFFVWDIAVLVCLYFAGRPLWNAKPE